MSEKDWKHAKFPSVGASDSVRQACKRSKGIPAHIWLNEQDREAVVIVHVGEGDARTLHYKSLDDGQLNHVKQLLEDLSDEEYKDPNSDNISVSALNLHTKGDRSNIELLCSGQHFKRHFELGHQAINS